MLAEAAITDPKVKWTNLGRGFGLVGIVAGFYTTATAAVEAIREVASTHRVLLKQIDAYESSVFRANVKIAALNALGPCDDEDEEDEGNDERKKSERPGSFDPNDITGPAAFGPANYLVPGVLMPYTIRFENDGELATAPAASVVVTQTLDSDLDWTTFRLGDIGFGDTIIDVPDDVAFFETRYDLTATHGVFVDITAGINIATGQIRWTFTAIDPETGDLPADPLVGFLPPNVNGPEGEGFINYTIRQKSSLVTGDRIDAMASIVFDVNDPILTPQIFHTIDRGAPTSQMTALPVTTSLPQFSVSWSGTDDAQGSGVATWDIFLSVDGGPFALYLDDTPNTSTTFIGTPLHTYAFYSVATDHVGHIEGTPSIADTSVTIEEGVDVTLNQTPATYRLKQKPAPAVDPTAALTIGTLSPNLTGARLVVSISQNRNKKDILKMVGNASAGLIVKGKNLLIGSTIIGTLSGGKGRVPDLTVTFRSTANLATAQTIMRNVTFATKSSGSGSRTVQMRLFNVQGLNSNISSRQINISN